MTLAMVTAPQTKNSSSTDSCSKDRVETKKHGQTDRQTDGRTFRIALCFPR